MHLHAALQVWGVRLATMLEDRDLGVLLGLSTLLLGVVSRSYEGEQPAAGLGWAAPCHAGAAGCHEGLPLLPLPGPPAAPPPSRLPAQPITLCTPCLPPGYEACVPRIVAVLERMKQRDVTQVGLARVSRV